MNRITSLLFETGIEITGLDINFMNTFFTLSCQCILILNSDLIFLEYKTNKFVITAILLLPF